MGTDRTVFDWPDIDAVAWMSFAEGDAHVEFACYAVEGFELDEAGEFTVKAYDLRGGNCDLTNDLDEAQPLFRGRIKNDACSHVDFGGSDRGYIHLCGPEAWRRMSVAMERIFAEAGKRLDDNNGFFEI